MQENSPTDPGDDRASRLHAAEADAMEIVRLILDGQAENQRGFLRRRPALVRITAETMDLLGIWAGDGLFPAEEWYGAEWVEEDEAVPSADEPDSEG